MRLQSSAVVVDRSHGRGSGFLPRWLRSEDGSTAIEFAIVVGPFFAFIFGIMVVGLQHFMQSNLEYSIEAASRQIRTGQAQTAGATMDQFKQQVCLFTAEFVDCDADLVVHVQSAPDWSTLVPTPCITNGAMTPPTADSADLVSDHSGGQSVSVLVTACYRWELAQMLWQSIYEVLAATSRAEVPEQLGVTVMQAAFTFKTEPYGTSSGGGGGL